MTETAELSAGLEGLIGRILVDRYRIDSLVGLGAMGAVFRGHQLTLKRDVAVKILHPELMQDDQIAKRFEREAESAARLEHPNIVQVLEQGATDDGFKFIVMQLLEGGELADRLDYPLPAAQCVVWAIQIFSALEHAHAHGIIHRDLKPENVFVSYDHDQREILKLVDFGIAKIVGGADSGEPMTKLGLVFGTPAYMSPEQATGVEIDERTDLYSAGVILYQMLAGAPPFRNDDPVALIRMQVSVDPPPLPDHVPPDLRAFVQTLLSKQRDERYSSATECREILESLLGGLDLEGLAVPSHMIRDVSGVVSAASAPVKVDHLTIKPSGAPPARREPGRAKLWIGVGGGALAVGLLAWLAWPSADSANGPIDGPVDSEDPSKQADPSVAQAPTTELEAIDRLLLAKSSDAALTLIKPLRDQYPQDPRLSWREGKALAMKKTTRDTALVRYGDALEVDQALIEDAEFYAELYDLLEDRRLRSEALDFALQKLGKNGHKFLLGLVNEKNPERALRYNDRNRALDELATDPESNAVVDHELNLARDLWQAPQAVTPCAAYRDALVAVSIAPDEFYLGTLRSRSVPKKPADDEDALICDALPDLRERVLAAYEAAYGATSGSLPPEPEPEPKTAPKTSSKKTSSKKTSSKKTSSKKTSSKKSSSKKSSSKKSSSKKKDPLEKVGKKLDKLFGGG